MKKIIISALAIVALAAGCNAAQTNQPVAGIQSRGPQVVQTSKCRSNGTLPDKSCTPGVVRTTALNIICHQTTKQFRPPASYTDKLKIQQIQEYGYTDTNPADYEEDHLISLELGGDGYDPKNLWPQPHTTSYQKDKIENLLHAEICSGEVTPQQAQQEIATDWTKVK